jgi:hypothetical protein
MSAHPIRRAARNLVALALVEAGAVASRAGLRAMHPDDRPQTETDVAITRAAEALTSSASYMTELAERRDIKPRDVKAFHRIAMQFLDLRAVAVGDHDWLRHREEERDRRRRLRANAAEAILTRRDVMPVEGPR